MTPGGTTLHFEGYADVDLCDPGGGTLSTLPAFLEATNPLVIDPPAIIAEGLECRDYVVRAIELAPTVVPGDYVFDSLGPHYSFAEEDTIEAHLDGGGVVASAPYDWHTFPPYDFVFPGLFTIRVDTLVGGNLYSVHDSIFEGRSMLRIVCD